ncbi:MAG TPA: carboxypeptidase-like regulatory domain-containing protein, partial [Gemmatimonadaceae bacterium]|nr:carboxypeptidase-like regulatory domain-containing protein [Gemmatimonadaceae bacterium]
MGQNSAHKSRIVGVVADSVSGAPLQGAEVVVGGVTETVTTDSLGRFTIDSLTPGTYQVGIFHPLLESLGIALATKPFAIGPDSAGVVNLAVPSVTTLVKRYCGTDQMAATPSSVVGRVLDPDTDVPVAGAKVTLAWTEIAVSKEAGVVRTPHELHTETNEIGFFKFCELPSDLDGTLQVVRGEALTPEVPMTVGGALLAFQSMSIPANKAPRANGIVMGHVMTLA